MKIQPHHHHIIRKTLKYIVVAVLGYFFIHLSLSYLYGRFYASRYTSVSGRPYTNAVCKAAPILPPSHRTVRILVLTGGAINGILPLHILQYLQNKTHQPIHKLFDLIAATSTGSIIATGLTYPKPGAPKHALFDTEAVLKFYTELGPYALSAPWWYRIITLDGLLGPRYLGTRLSDQFSKIFNKHAWFDQLLTPTMISVYDLTKHRVLSFKSWYCNANRTDYHIHEILTAATATPGFFPPVRLQNNEKKESDIFIDGGVAVNNPAMLALESAMKLYPHRQYSILVLDTGNMLDAINWQQSYTWGAFGWVPKTFAILMTTQQNQADNSLHFIQSLLPKGTINIQRINIRITKPESKFNPSKANIRLLKTLADEYIKNNQKKLDAIGKQLTAES